MFRPSASPRFFVGLALAAVVGTGIGLGVADLGSSPAPAAPLALHPRTVSATSSDAPPTIAPAPPAPLTIDQAKAVALQASPGTVVEVKQENGANDPTEANDPAEANDPTEANDPAEAPDAAEPTGLSYDVTIQHADGTATKVVVDGATGHVVSTKAEDNANGD